MKKVLWLIVCLMTMVLSVNAQDDMYMTKKNRQSTNKELSPINKEVAEKNGWLSVTHEADELIDTKEYTSLVYSNENGSVVLWDSEKKKMRITTNGVFDSEVQKAGWNLMYRNLFEAIVGMYDMNGKLIEKKNCWFEIGANHSQGNSTQGASGKNEGGSIISYLRNEKGYVRIVAPLYGTNSNFDIKVPCINN